MDKPILEIYQLDSEDIITTSMVAGDDKDENLDGNGGDIVWDNTNNK